MKVPCDIILLAGSEDRETAENVCFREHLVPNASKEGRC